MIAQAALQEDVDVVWLSILSGAHMALVPRVLKLLQDSGMGQVIVFVGGIIPDEDAPVLREMGIQGIYGPGTSLDDIASAIRAAVGGRG